MVTRDPDIITFIDRFTNSGKRKEVIDAFTNGCCYWMAAILKQRFSPSHTCYIMYDPVINHFGCYIDGYVYDITGDVTKSYNWVNWEDYVPIDALETNRIIRDCINF